MFLSYATVIAILAQLSVFAIASSPVYDGGAPSPPAAAADNSNLITQTVYGFLDFTTTIGNTIMVFSPQSAPPPEPLSTEKSVQENIIETKPPPTVINIKPEEIKPSKLSTKDKEKKATPILMSSISVVTSDKNDKPVKAETLKIKPTSQLKEQVKPTIQSIVQVVSENSKSDDTKQQDDDVPAILVPNNNLGEPEYDFLSRQPSEFVEETYKVINLRPSKIPQGQKPKHKHRVNPPTPPPEDDDEEHPVGLVTTLGGTIVKDGLTTVHETSVIGTYINGKYAQVLNSNSKVLSGHRPKISPSSPHRILKTSAPAITKNQRHNSYEPTASLDEESGFGKSTRRPSSGSSFKNRHRPQSSSDEVHESPQSSKKFHKNRNSQSQRTTSESSTPSSFSNRRKNNRKTTPSPPSNEGQPRRGFKPRIQATPVDVPASSSSSIYKFKLNRQPGSGRWQYKTSPKPKVTIRKMKEDPDEQTTPNSNPLVDDLQTNDVSPQSRSDDLELQGSQSGPGALLDNDTDDNSIEKPPPVETLKVEISTPADFKDVYYEIATIKSPYTFQVGRVKNTRIITVTSTYERRIEPTQIPAQNSLNEPLTENILAPSAKDHNLLDGSIATLPAITLNADMETPPLETVTEKFSTTQDMLKTHILPVVRENTTSSLTFIQTYHVTRFVTATKTLPPMEFFQFIPSKTLKEFNSRLDEAGSELNLDIDFGDSNEDEDGVPRRVFPPDLDLANVGSELDLSEVDNFRMPDNHLRAKKAHGQSKSNHVTEAPTPPTPALTPEQAQQLALLRLLNPAAAAQIPNVVTTSKPVLKYETVYESHVIPYFDGKSTVHSTISRPVATVTKTEYEIGTSSLPALPLNPINPFQQQQFTVTSTPVVVNTQVTATDSQVLKLTFGAKTVYTTLFNTKVVPTVVTSYVTSTIPVLPNAGLPGFFPSPFAQFPYVG